ncbi:hypothetical protein O3M35_006610 [Rhynocoris fuscipes]|uniref:Uncharacterized protein n=1 Tax=Rhynocoris fuscipes TaxID=488301 RepID=A0AAW1DE06_9HEMI
MFKKYQLKKIRKSGRFHLNKHIKRIFKLKYKEEKKRKSRNKVRKWKNLNKRIYKKTNAVKFCGEKLPHLKRLIELDLSGRIMVEPSGKSSPHGEVKTIPNLETESSNSVKNKANVDNFTGKCFKNAATVSSVSPKESSLSIPAYYNQIDATKQINVCSSLNRNSFKMNETNNAKIEKLTSDIENYFETYLHEYLPIKHNIDGNCYNGDQPKFLQPSNNEAERANTRNNFSEERYNDNYFINSDSNISVRSKAIKSNSYVPRIMENPFNYIQSNKIESNQKLSKDTEKNNQLKYSLVRSANNKDNQTRKVVLLNEKINNYRPDRSSENRNVHRINYPKTISERFTPRLMSDTESDDSINRDKCEKISFGQYIKIKSKCLTMFKSRHNNSITIYCQHCTNRKKRRNKKLKRKSNLKRSKKITKLDRNINVGEHLINQPKIGFPLWRYFNPNHPYYAHSSFSQYYAQSS